MVWVTPVPPVTAAIRSSQTAVGVCATLAICEPRVPPLAAAAVVTSSRQSGLMKPTAPEYGLSTCLPLGGLLVLTDADGDTDLLGDTEADGDVDREGLVDGDGDVDTELLGLGDALGLPGTVPLQTAPFRVNELGTGLLPVHAPLKPIVVVPPVPN